MLQPVFTLISCPLRVSPFVYNPSQNPPLSDRPNAHRIQSIRSCSLGFRSTVLPAQLLVVGALEVAASRHQDTREERWLDGSALHRRRSDLTCHRHVCHPYLVRNRWFVGFSAALRYIRGKSRAIGEEIFPSCKKRSLLRRNARLAFVGYVRHAAGKVILRGSASLRSQRQPFVQDPAPCAISPLATLHCTPSTSLQPSL